MSVSTGAVGAASALLEVRASFVPRDARQLLSRSIDRRLRSMINADIVVVAPFLSPRTREILAAESIGYIDLAGNIRLELQNVFVHVDRTAVNPDAKPTGAPKLRGAIAGLLIRVLVDAYPPYLLTDIAKAAGVDRGYASRILDALSDEALVDRESRGPVTDVDWPALLRARAAHLDLFARPAQGYIAPQGASVLLDRLRTKPPNHLWAVTGSFAAVRRAPIAAPALLVIYTMEPRRLADDHQLLAAAEGADVMLVRPSNYGPFDRRFTEGGIPWAAWSQVALDCLSGNGRMPAEGEALIGWMADHEDQWRTTLDHMPPPTSQS